jgi:predicted membrane metal-binding protein
MSQWHPRSRIAQAWRKKSRALLVCASNLSGLLWLLACLFFLVWVSWADRQIGWWSLSMAIARLSTRIRTTVDVVAVGY